MVLFYNSEFVNKHFLPLSLNTICYNQTCHVRFEMISFDNRIDGKKRLIMKNLILPFSIHLQVNMQYHALQVLRSRFPI